jgi:hypothetical protein
MHRPQLSLALFKQNRSFDSMPYELRSCLLLLTKKVGDTTIEIAIDAKAYNDLHIHGELPDLDLIRLPRLLFLFA